MSDLDLELREKYNIPDEKDAMEWCEENGIDYQEELINIYYGNLALDHLIGKDR